MYIETDSVGDLIIKLRQKNNLSVIELAEKLKVSRQSIHYWQKEKNKLSTETLSVILNVIGDSVLIEDGKYKIPKERKMDNKQLILDFANFDMNTILKEHEEKSIKKANDFSNKTYSLLNELEDKGFKVYINNHWNPIQWRKELCNQDTIVSIEKDDKCMEIVIDKASSVEIFDIDTFIDNISNKYGLGVGEQVKKSIFFTAYTFGLGSDIFSCFKSNKSKNTILNILPTLEGIEDIVHDELKNKDLYFYESNGAIYNSQFPLSILLDICDEFASDYIWIKLTNEDDEEKFLEDSFESPIILEALEYIKDNFDIFDTLFDEAVE